LSNLAAAAAAAETQKATHSKSSKKGKTDCTPLQIKRGKQITACTTFHYLRECSIFDMLHCSLKNYNVYHYV